MFGPPCLGVLGGGFGFGDALRLKFLQAGGFAFHLDGVGQLRAKFLSAPVFQKFQAHAEHGHVSIIQ